MRLYKGYPLALRWLACNRAGNSVSLHFDEKIGADRELWIIGRKELRKALPTPEELGENGQSGQPLEINL